MDWITEQIAIGNFREAKDWDLLQREGIASVLSLYRPEDDPHLLPEDQRPIDVCWLDGREAVNDLHRDLPVLEAYPLVDGLGNDAALYRRALKALDRLVHQAPPVLVHCHAGRSRSAAVVAGYFVRFQGLDHDNALCLVEEKREIHLHPALRRLLYAL